MQKRSQHTRICYSTAEACRMANISKNTFLRWVREGKFVDVGNRDRNGWRLFTSKDINRLRTRVNHIEETPDTQNQYGSRPSHVASANIAVAPQIPVPLLAEAAVKGSVTANECHTS